MSCGSFYRSLRSSVAAATATRAPAPSSPAALIPRVQVGPTFHQQVMSTTKRQKMERSSRDNPQDNIQDHQDNQYNDKRKPAARAFVWVKVPIDDQHKAKLSVEVKAGYFIDSIKEAIKKKRSNAFASIDASDLELFESEQDIEQKKPPLDARMKWNSTVTWGTENTPLFVQVPVKRISESPRSNNNGEC